MALGVSEDIVPAPRTGPDAGDWWTAWRSALASRTRCSAVRIDVDDLPPATGKWIAGLRTSVPGVGHAVLCDGPRVIFDPAREATGPLDLSALVAAWALLG